VTPGGGASAYCINTCGPCSQIPDFNTMTECNYDTYQSCCNTRRSIEATTTAAAYVRFDATVPLTKLDFNAVGDGYKAALASAVGARQSQVSVTGIREYLGKKCVVGFQLPAIAGRSLVDLRDGLDEDKINQELASRGLLRMTLSQLSEAEGAGASGSRGRLSGGALRGSFRRCSCGGGGGDEVPWWGWLLLILILVILVVLILVRDFGGE
jgi:hypothetical protein